MKGAVAYREDGTENLTWDSKLLDNAKKYTIYFFINNRHSYIYSMTSNQSVTVEFESKRYWEAPDSVALRQRESKEDFLPLQYQDAVHMLRNLSEQQLLGSQDDALQEHLYSQLHNYPIRGIWSSTIVPAAKDFAKWTKNVMSKTHIPQFLADNAGDIALVALSTV